MKAEVILGDCLDVMRTMPAASVDAVVTDPPYGLSFMGKLWDHGVPGEQFWAEALRVAKPGAALLAFGGTRTFHRLACAIEDGGWRIYDCLAWLYGQGFPKHRTHLKPAWEPVIFASKKGARFVNVEGCRLGTTVGTWPASRSYAPGQIQPGGKGKTQATGEVPPGRWPANVLLDEEAARMVDEQSGILQSGVFSGRRNQPKTKNSFGNFQLRDEAGASFGDSGGASRFFYASKATRADREDGLENAPVRAGGAMSGRETRADRPTNHPVVANHHPTIKPTDLMRWLCRLVTPPGGTVLDPFCGSGSTGVAALSEGFDFIGIEREVEYVEIARRRIANVAPRFAQGGAA